MHPWEHTRAARLSGPIGLGLLTIGGMLALSCFGLAPGTETFLGPVSLIMLLFNAGGLAFLYLFGAIGLGRPLAALLAKNSTHRMWIQLGLGLAAMLWISHALGVLGLLSGPGPRPRIVGWGVVGVGILLLADQIIRGPLRPERWPVIPASVMLWGPGLAVLLVAAASPPGMVWGPTSTEHGAYDALSYHLQLPKEWAAGARLWPTDHNVYSYLPSFVEAAYLHLGTMMVGGLVTNPNDPVQRMIGGEGNWVIACQYLHVGLAIAASLLTSRAAWALAKRCDAEDRAARVLGVLAGAFTLCTPWMIVVSSLPYNEAGLLALGAAGVLIAIDAGLAPWARGAAAGIAVGAACGCKPTALFMVGPLVGLLLLGCDRPGTWARMIAGGVVTGLAAIAPWLLRNWLACGNPVFPFGASIFGTGHWTAEQVARHNANHHAPPGTGIGERLARLFSGEFGLTQAQWGIALLVTAIALVGALVWNKSRRIGMLLTLGLAAQAACWMAFTHLQSRFLLPLLTPATLLLTLAGAALVAWMSRSAPATATRRSPLALAALLVLSLAPLSQAVRSVSLFLEQNTWLPNQGLVYGVGALTGLSLDDKVRNSDEIEREKLFDAIGPVAYINLKIRPQETVDAGVYLLGDSTPLYLLGATGDAAAKNRAASPVVYHTAWDTSPLMLPPTRTGTNNVHPWSSSLRDRGVRYVLVNYSELERLIEKSHYYDPALTLKAIQTWLHAPESRLRPIRVWRESGTELLEIDIAPLPAILPAPGHPTGGVRP
jgi:hypothetical protein